MGSLDNASCGKFFDGLAMPGGDFKGAEELLQHSKNSMTGDEFLSPKASN